MAFGRVAVTGATGFIGHAVVDKLVAEHAAQVIELVRPGRRFAGVHRPGVTTTPVSLDDRAALERALTGCDALINLAYDFHSSPALALERFDHLLHACSSAGVGRFVQTSSIVVYDDWPWHALDESSASSATGDAYKATKWRMERALEDHSRTTGLPFVVLQPTIVYGPGGYIWTDRLVERLLTGPVMLPNDGVGLCPAVFVSDVADAHVLAATAEVSGEKFIISGSAPVSWAQFFGAYVSALGRGTLTYFPCDAAALQHKPAPLSHSPARVPGWKQRVGTLAREFERQFGAEGVRKLRLLRGRARSLAGPTPHWPSDSELALFCSQGHCAIDKARRLLRYEPKVDFDHGAQITANYIRATYASHGRSKHASE